MLTCQVWLSIKTVLTHILLDLISLLDFCHFKYFLPLINFLLYHCLNLYFWRRWSHGIWSMRFLASFNEKKCQYPVPFYLKCYKHSTQIIPTKVESTICTHRQSQHLTPYRTCLKKGSTYVMPFGFWVTYVIQIIQVK